MPWRVGWARTAVKTPQMISPAGSLPARWVPRVSSSFSTPITSRPRGSFQGTPSRRFLSRHAWWQTLDRGHETELIEIPANWYLDDLPPMMFVKKSPNSHGFVDPRAIEQMWRDQFDWVYREFDYAVFTMTIHPDVSGRPQVLLMHERLIDHINSHQGVRWVTFNEIATDFAQRHPRTGHSGS